MRIIYIEPVKRIVAVRETRPTLGELQSLCGGDCEPHWIVAHTIPNHIGLVDEEGLIKKRRMWFFNNVNIWGPMVIMGNRDGKSATVTLDKVMDLVQF